MRAALKKWRIAIGALVFTAVLGIVFPEAGRETLKLLGDNVSTIIGILVPVFILLGLFDAWVPRERIAPHLGDASGIRGIVLAVLLGASSAGPLYVAFPVAEVMLRKGTSLRNVFIFLGSWSSMRLPMVLFEIQSVGSVFALSRFAASLSGILIMGVLLERLLGVEDRKAILERFEK